VKHPHWPEVTDRALPIDSTLRLLSLRLKASPMTELPLNVLSGFFPFPVLIQQIVVLFHVSCRRQRWNDVKLAIRVDNLPAPVRIAEGMSKRTLRGDILLGLILTQWSPIRYFARGPWDGARR